jgi:DNA (cytosine-5)-methyltransferase 1
MNLIHCGDLFCGAGGTSTGLVNAAIERGLVPSRDMSLVAVNHWARAVETHTKNHPWAKHMCADLNGMDPRHAVPGGYLDLLVASPECTHHSLAKGGTPVSEQSRASGFHVTHWLSLLNVRNLLIENVKEYIDWGPTRQKRDKKTGKLMFTEDGKPWLEADPAHKGETFQAFVQTIKSLGYEVEYRVLNAADYGEATCRYRMFLQATKDGPITWPVPTHVGKWRPAREIIDWTIPGTPIHERKRPLKENTLKRIEAGLRKFGGEAFICCLRGTDPSQFSSGAQLLDKPLTTVSAGGIHHAVCEPFVIGQQSGAAPRSVNEPLPTIAGAGAIALCEPFIVQIAHQGGDRVRSIEEPLPTIPAGHRGELALCEPFVIPMEHGGRQPPRSIEHPLPTISTAKGGAFGLVEPFIVKYYGTAKATSVDEPLDAVTTKGRFALVEPGQMGIRFRMFRPHELAAAMGFDNYHFCGGITDQTKQIGNAVSVRMAKAITGAILDRVLLRKEAVA